MKTMQLTAVIFAGWSFAACAQDVPQNEVPSVVVNAFQAAYPAAVDADWEKRGAVYEVEFETGKTDHEAWLDATGKIVRHEEEIAKSAVPQVVRDAVAANFKNYRIDDADKIEKNGAVYYRIELEGTMGERTVFLDANGKQVADTGFLYE